MTDLEPTCTVMDAEREERRYAERHPLPQHQFCPTGCRCPQCIWDEASDELRGEP